MVSILSDKRILAVDDEPDVLETLEEELSDIPGIVLDKATDYETAHQLLLSWTYDLVILDIMGVRGFDLLRIATIRNFPAVMLTAHALTKDALKRSVEMGARAFIPKEKMKDIKEFLEDVLTLGYGPGWKRLLGKLGGVFGSKFGSDWQKSEEKFWNEVASGQYTPTIIS
ncbi:MAG: response regulator [Desulfatiglandales bacterium]